MRRPIRLTRREFVLGGAFIGKMAGFGMPRLSWAQTAPPKPASTKPGIVDVVVFSNFEGWLQNPGPAVRWFESCSQAHPSITWTHMYSPRYLVVQTPEMIKAGAEFTPYLLKARASGRAEVGLHIHLFYDLIRQAGVQPRAYPFATDSTASCNFPRTTEQDSSNGYDVLLNGYTAKERSKIIDAGINAFLHSGLGRPKSFCAGYSAADPALQAMLARKSFTASFAAQVIHPNQYGGCWDRLLDWSGHITPLSIPYRVSRSTILPPPHADKKHLDLVEVPLNMGVDATDLYLENQKVTRADMFDRHYDWARDTGGRTAVAIGVHADVVGLEEWGSGPVSRVIDGFLDHVAQRSREGAARIQYGTVSEVARDFRQNSTVGHV
jgi:hypothetical protein